ncbi:hypothetical protein [Paenibacillus sp. NPDC058071]|uniref:hypothetical protein n=1 Tax=Paenibacillus sp. NPDC058071 TaxID=3346326 RepID=UPI0036DA083D
MRKAFKRLVITLVVLAALIAGGGLWLMSYVAPDEQLNLSYEPIDLKEKALSMVKRLSPELVLTESDINNLIKMQLRGGDSEGLPPDVRLDGVRFELDGDRLLAHLNVTYKDRFPAGLLASYKLEWKEPNLIVTPVELKLKGYELSTASMERYMIPLDIGEQALVRIGDIRFDQNSIAIRLQMQL